MTKDKKKIFVCGCPRSGTTVLTQLLNWHPKISIGIERYGKFLERNPQRFTPQVFGINRFFDIRPGDCFYDSFEFKAYSDWCCSEFSRSKYQKSIYVGEKNPEFYKHFELLKYNFDRADSKIIFILRDVYSVAESYNVRANNPDDKWKSDNDFKQAIIDWNESVSAVYRELEQELENLILVSYDDLFSDFQQGKHKLPDLFNRLELNVHQDVLNGYKLLEKYGREMQRNRKKKLERAARIFKRKQKRMPNNPELLETNEIDKDYIISHALLDRYNNIVDRCV